MSSTTIGPAGRTGIIGPAGRTGMLFGRGGNGGGLGGGLGGGTAGVGATLQGCAGADDDADPVDDDAIACASIVQRCIDKVHR